METEVGTQLTAASIVDPTTMTGPDAQAMLTAAIGTVLGRTRQ